MIRLLVFDQHPIIHFGFEKIASQTRKIKLLTPIYKHKQLISILKSRKVDVLLMEIENHTTSLICYIEKIRVQFPDVKIIIFTYHPVSIFVNTLLKSGAQGFISKRTHYKGILEAIEFVHKSNGFVVSKHGNELNYTIDLVRPRNTFGTLTPKELQILKYLMEGKKNTFIAERMKVSPKTIHTYKRRLTEKLGTNNFCQLNTHKKLLGFY